MNLIIKEPRFSIRTRIPPQPQSDSAASGSACAKTPEQAAVEAAVAKFEAKLAASRVSKKRSTGKSKDGPIDDKNLGQRTEFFADNKFISGESFFSGDIWWDAEYLKNEALKHPFGNVHGRKFSVIKEEFRTKGIKAALRPCSSQSPLHVNTTTIHAKKKRESRHKDDRTKFSKATGWLTVTKPDGEMRHANHYKNRQKGADKIDKQIEVDIQHASASSRGTKRLAPDGASKETSASRKKERK